MIVEDNIISDSFIYNILNKTKCKIYSKYNFNIKGIDYILEHNNLLLCFQDKINCNNNDINNFNSTLNLLKVEFNKFNLIGIYLTNKLSYCYKQKANINNIIIINGENLYTIKYKLLEYLYSLNIYNYDNNNDIIMLN